MKRRRIVVAAVLGVPLVLLAGAAAFLAWLLYTASGAQWAADLARQHLEPTVAFEAVDGRLAGPLTVEGLVVRTAAATVHVRHAALDWAPLDLWNSRIRVRSLEADGVDVALAEEPGRGEPAPESGAGGLPDRLGLPVEIIFERVRIRDVRVEPGGGTGLAVERIALAAAAGPEGIRIDSLAVDAPIADVRGGLSLAGGAPYEIEGALDLRARPAAAGMPSLPAVDARLVLGGRLEALEADLDVRAPDAARVEVLARLLGPEPSWRARLRVPGTTLSSWYAGVPEWRAEADLRLAGTLAEVDAAGRIGFAGLPVGALDARVDLRATPSRVAIKALRVTTPARPEAVVEAGGTIDLEAGGPRLDVSLSWENLAWPIGGEGEEAVAGGSGRARVAGTPEDYWIEGKARVRAAAAGPEPVTLDWRGRGSLAGLGELDVEAAWHEARLEAEGEVRWAGEGRARARVVLEGLRPQRLGPVPEGRIGAAARIEARWGETPRARLVLEELEGDLDGRPLSGSGAVDYAGTAATIDELVVRVGNARARIDGVAGRALDLDWEVTVPELASLLRDVRGHVRGRGEVAGTPAAPRIRVDAEARGLAVGELRIDTVRVDGAVSAASGDDTILRVGVRGAAAPGLRVRSADVELQGRLARQRVVVTVDTDRGSAELALEGGLEDGEWLGRLARGAVTPAGRDTWRLDEPAALAWRDGVLDVERGCWRQRDARACIAARAAGAEEWQVTFAATAVPVETVAAYWRDDLTWTGRFDVRGELRAAGGGPVTGRARLQTSAGRVLGTLDAETTTLLDYGRGSVELELDAREVGVTARLPLAADGLLAARLQVERGEPADLDGRIEARVTELGLLGALVPQVGAIEGRLLADLALGGTLAAPTVAGNARLADGRVAIAPLGIRLADVEADLDTAAEGLRLRVRASSGEGRVQAEVRARRDAAAGWATRGSVRGEGFEAVDLPEANVRVTPDLQWSMEGRAVTVTGEVSVPEARIEPRDLSGTVQTSPDAVVVGAREREAQAEAPWQVTADVGVVLGPEVRIDAFGLEARLEGALDIRERPGRLTTATGELRVAQGTYTVYRQTLQIERGRVLFGGGPVADPGLDIRAVRRPRGVLVGVNVRGTLRTPRVELFSDPPMPESQQLSYLIVGVPLGETSAGEQSTVAAAAAALASSRQGSQLASELGIQEVRVDEGGPGEGASLVLGRYLSPRLYVGYGIGLLEQANSIRARYELTEHWTLEGRSGVTSSADLLYTIEVDASREAIPDLPTPELPGMPAASGRSERAAGDAPGGDSAVREPARP